MLSFYFHDMDLYQVVLWFFIYSFLGWAMECVVIRKQNGYWENRGFANLPFCVIYGFALFIAFHIFDPIRDNYFALYFAGAIGATAFEYLTGVLMNHLFGEIWWDYNNKKFNYKGVVCLESTIAWGFVAVFVFGFLNRQIENFVLSLNHNLVMVLSLVLAASYVVDFALNFKHSYQSNKVSEEREA